MEFWTVTTVKLEYTRALKLTIDSNLPDQTRSVQTGELKEEDFQVEPMRGMEKQPLAGRMIFATSRNECGSHYTATLGNLC